MQTHRKMIEVIEPGGPSSNLTRRAFARGEVAAAIGASPGFVDLEIRRGHLKAIRRGRRVFVTASALAAYLGEA